MENWIKVVIFAATITVSTMGCERHKLHIYRTGNVESLHFETSQMECGRLIREDQPAFFFTFFYMPNGNGNKKMPQLSSENCGWLPHRETKHNKFII